MTQDHSTKTLVMPANDIVQYIRQNHDSWYSFATNSMTYGLQCKPEEIIMIRGTVKTSAWQVAAFIDDGGHTHDVSFSGQIGPFVDAGFQVTSQTTQQPSHQHRSGPNKRLSTLAPIMPRVAGSSRPPGRLELPELEVAATMTTTNAPANTKDQTVFLSCYKIKRRVWFTKKVVAAGEPQEPERDDQPPGTPGNIDVEMNVPQITVGSLQISFCLD